MGQFLPMLNLYKKSGHLYSGSGEGTLLHACFCTYRRTCIYMYTYMYTCIVAIGLCIALCASTHYPYACMYCTNMYLTHSIERTQSNMYMYIIMQCRVDAAVLMRNIVTTLQNE